MHKNILEGAVRLDKWLRNIMFAVLIVAIIIGISASYYLLLEFTALQAPLIGMLKSFFSMAFALYIFMVGFIILMENKNPSKTIAWLLILFLLPYVGFVFYILFGRNYRNKYRTRKKSALSRRRLDLEVFEQRKMMDYLDLFFDNDSYVDNRLINLLLKNSNSPFSVNNEVEILTNGEVTFERMIEHMERAEKHIHFQFFIIRNDDIGNRVKQVLMKKAREGVKVRVIYDSVGCWRMGRKYREDLIASGCEVHAFFPVVFPILSRELNYRNHRKIVIVDGQQGFLGGLNIGDEYLGKNKVLGFWRDTHMRVHGESVYSLQEIFLNDWTFVSKQDIEGLNEQELFPRMETVGNTAMQITGCGPDSNWKSILQAYFTMIATAENRIWITTPYLVPDESLKMGLITAAMSGIDVRIIIPGRPDHFFVYWASQDNIQPLLEAGVKIYRYTKGFVHSKILLVDGIGASVGTANLDIRSLEINYEVNAFIYDAEVVRRLEADFYMDLSDSEAIDLETFMNRPMYRKVLEACGRLVSPIQ